MIYAVLLVAGAIAWFISTVAAGGAATLLIPVIGFLLGAEMVAPIISVAAICANPSRAWLFRKHINRGVITRLLPGSFLGAIIGAWSLTRLNPQWIQIALGLFLVTTVLQYRFGKRAVTFTMKLWWFFPLGFTASFLSGIVGATGPVLNPFMLNYGLEKEDLVGTKSLNSLVMQLTKLTGYSLFGALSLQTGVYGIALGIGSIAGVHLARNHLFAIDAQRFRIYTMILMTFAGVLMLIKAF